MCQGMHTTERSLFLATTRIVWGFNINKPIGPDGKPIEADIEDLVGGMTVQPNGFCIDMTPRSEKKTEMIRQVGSTAKKIFWIRSPSSGRRCQRV